MLIYVILQTKARPDKIVLQYMSYLKKLCVDNKDIACVNEIELLAPTH